MMRLIVLLTMLSFSLVGFSDEVAKKEGEIETVPSNVKHLSDLLVNIKGQSEKNAITRQQREILFSSDYSVVKSQLEKSKTDLRNVKTITKELKSTFENNEEDLSALDAELKKSLGNLGEMFGVVRQVAQDVSSTRDASLLKVELGAHSEVLARLSESKALPSISELEMLWFEMQNQMTKQGEIKRFSADYVDINGDGYLNFDPETGLFLQMGKQPSSASDAIDFFEGSSDVFSNIAIDPTRGSLLSLSSQSPSYIDRIHQGGVIGYIILMLAILGVSFGLFLLVNRLQLASKVSLQLKNVSDPSLDNPLGRVLAVYQNEKEISDLETLEMKLDEAVLKELPDIEKGQSIIKLLAAVAPLLGLLGTVTGMIATFQSITLFGTGDPKLMAGGISQALITTVLGLVAAIPLLFVHNLIASRSKALIQVLTQQSAGMIAEQAQKRS